MLLWPKNLICLDSNEHREVQAEAMVDQTEGVDNLKWFDFASTCMLDSTWEIAVKRPTSSLSHRTCPWGGHLIRFDNRTPPFARSALIFDDWFSSLQLKCTLYHGLEN